MKSCRCLEIDPENAYEQCLLPWGHDEETHISGFSVWKDNEKAKYEEKQKV